MTSRNIYFIYRKSDGKFFSHEDKKEIFAYRDFARAKIFIYKPVAERMLTTLGEEHHVILPFSIAIHTVETKNA